MNAQFLLLIVSLPPNPSSLRVRVWRRLRALGAVALKRTVYLLPDTPDNYEQFHWLGQEIQRERGETILLRVDQIENMSRADMIRLFHEARDPEYRQLATRAVASHRQEDAGPAHEGLREASGARLLRRAGTRRSRATEGGN